MYIHFTDYVFSLTESIHIGCPNEQLYYMHGYLRINPWVENSEFISEYPCLVK